MTAPLAVEWLCGAGPVLHRGRPPLLKAWRFVDKLIEANKLFEMMIYPMRMHGIADEPARIHLYSKMLEFWKRNL